MIKRFHPFVNEQVNNVMPTAIAIANEMLNNEKMTGVILNCYNSLNPFFQEKIKKFVNKRNIDLSMIEKFDFDKIKSKMKFGINKILDFVLNRKNEEFDYWWTLGSSALSFVVFVYYIFVIIKEKINYGEVQIGVIGGFLVSMIAFAITISACLNIDFMIQSNNMDQEYMDRQNRSFELYINHKMDEQILNVELQKDGKIKIDSIK